MSCNDADALAEALGWDHERVHLLSDPETGLRAVIAIHSTVLGPALGGMRIRRYERGLPEALDDALRLSRAMTLKAAAAGLDLGGGKAVMIDDGDESRRRARIVALAREIELLGGAYITAEDVGTTTADMDLVAEHSRHVVGRTRTSGVGGDPSPLTARTVLGAIKAAFEVLDGDPSLAGRAVGVVGLGKVGGTLALLLLAEGARVIGCDPVEETRARMSAQGVECVTGFAEVLAADIDVLAPCAVGGLVDDGVASRLGCRVLCGAANNPLADAAAERALLARGILYVPDFLANCGGLINVDCERRSCSEETLEEALDDARERTRSVLLEARESDRAPGLVAEERAWSRIEAARGAAQGDGSAAAAKSSEATI